jgi:hypothetical protein|tara:strand:- start:514 stop:1050 length:537 start_codon:yes stop_codon:yes gene_type:complete
MFKDFDISSFKKMKPPSDNSFDTMQEVKELEKTPLNKKFVKDNDDIEAAFKKTAAQKNIKNYDKSIAAKLIKASAPIILKLKKHFDRPRPKVLAKKLNINMKDIEMDSMKTASYPSGHSVQGMLIGKMLGDEYPEARTAFAKTGKNISDSRRSARAHYKSDSKMGEKLGDAMYNFLKK